MNPSDSSWLVIPSEVREAAELLWSYHQLGLPLAAADGILVFGSNDLRVAEHAVSLFQAGMGPWILFSGARGRMTQDWPETEAASMAARARSLGVPEECILIENRATHTGENIRFSRELLAESGRNPRSVIVVQKPYMERRTQAAMDVQWPGIECVSTSPPFDLQAYFTDELPPRLVIAAMIGDFQRILDYPALGFASRQNVPEEARAAYKVLLNAGYHDPLC